MGHDVAPNSGPKFSIQGFISVDDVEPPADPESFDPYKGDPQDWTKHVNEANSLVSSFLFSQGCRMPIPEGDSLYDMCKTLAMVRYKMIKDVNQNRVDADRHSARIGEMEKGISAIIGRPSRGSASAYQ